MGAVDLESETVFLISSYPNFREISKRPTKRVQMIGSDVEPLICSMCATGSCFIRAPVL